MARVTVLCPVPPPVEQSMDPGPAFSHLDGGTVGIRTEWIWPAFHTIADEWQKALQERGATVIRYQARRRIDDGHGIEDELEWFVRQVDLAVIGLGN
jgi:hypothetical protein